MISDRGMESLRVAATLAHVIPGLGVRIRHGSSVILEVDSMPSEGSSPQRRIAASAFRCAVAKAHRRRQDGEQLRFLDLPPGCDPVIDVAVPVQGVGRPGGIFCAPLAGRWLWGMAATIDAASAYELGADIVADASPQPGVHALGIRPDVALEVSLVYAETCTGPGSQSEAWVVDLFESLLARWTVHDLERRLNLPVDVDRGIA